jgi:hypothetical protein
MEEVWNRKMVAHPVYRAGWSEWSKRLESHPGKKTEIKKVKRGLGSHPVWSLKCGKRKVT